MSVADFGGNVDVNQDDALTGMFPAVRAATNRQHRRGELGVKQAVRHDMQQAEPVTQELPVQPAVPVAQATPAMDRRPRAMRSLANAINTALRRKTSSPERVDGRTIVSIAYLYDVQQQQYRLPDDVYRQAVLRREI
jgi:hypothetical protein